MFNEYGALLLNLIFCAAVPLFMVSLTSILGPKKVTPEKAQPFETGYVLPAPKSSPYRPHFLLYAILFVVFDMEIVFLYPWAVSFARTGITGLAVVFFFLGVLGFGLLYAWRKGALTWR